jgi:hypothetical protein
MATGRQLVTFDFRDHPALLNILRMMAARQKTTQKAILIEALTAYFSNKQETLGLLLAAENTFAEWDNEDDQVYDAL